MLVLARKKFRKIQRRALISSFYLALLFLVWLLLSSYINLGNTKQLSAYDDDWDDISEFRKEISNLGIDTKSLVSSPLLLNEIENPTNTTFVISGVEKDTFSLPSIGSDSGFISFSEPEGYSGSEISAITSFVARGGTVIVLDDFGYSSGIADEVGISYSNHRLYDDEYAVELDYNYVWMNISQNHTDWEDSEQFHIGHSRWHQGTDPTGTGMHPCSIWSESEIVFATKEEAGLCSHHYNSTSKMIDYSPDYNLLLNAPSAFESIEFSGDFSYYEAVGRSSPQSYLDLNDDGKVTLETETAQSEADAQGPFDVYIETCDSSDCADSRGGRIYFISDGSVLINAIYDFESANSGEYDEDGKSIANIPVNDNRKWILDVIAESALTANNFTNKDAIFASSDAMVIFDESRHSQNVLFTDAYNLIYFLLVYLTGDGIGMLLLFILLFLAFEAVLIKKTDPEPWRHIFNIIYYGFGDAKRYGYYTRTNKIKQVFLSRVRNLNALSREEFDRMPAQQLQELIKDPQLIKFVFENKKYDLEQTVAIVKRIKAWQKS
ncbi:MAG: Uncharacterised protein [Methanobacteriota archaeon]|nr:MAG: Uncharacterised protein [Euryarchaeota archaeon]